MSIIDEKVLIKVGGQQVSYYEKLGYENVKFRERLLINIEDLPKKSMFLVKVSCDNKCCYNESSVRYQDYNKSIEKYGNYYCKLCKSLRIKETCVEKYGVINVSQIEEVKSKRINTYISKYGVEHPMKSDVIKSKMMNTHINNFGCHYTQTKKHREYMHDYIVNRYGIGNNFLNIETMISKYGVEHPLKSIEIMGVRNITNLEKYGNVCSLHGVIQKDKVIKTCLKRYGVETPFSSLLIRDKIREYFLYNYGVDNPSKVPYIHSKKIKTSFKVNNYKNLTYQGSYEKDFLDSYSDKLNILNGLSFNYKYDCSDRIYHSDFYLPEYNLIIEIKSSYFYLLELNKNLSKEKVCLNNGYNFIFIIDKNYSEFSKIIKK